jgi:hypothetical protein
MNEMPQRIQLSRAKGWRMPPNTVKVDRSTRYGNPFAAGRFVFATGPKQGQTMTQADAAQAFRNLMATNLRMEPAKTRAVLDELRGKNLACWCKAGEPCHADVLLELANAEIKELRGHRATKERT